jgi:hypothetical protein
MPCLGSGFSGGGTRSKETVIARPELQRQDTSSPKFRLLRRRRRAAWDDDYLTKPEPSAGWINAINLSWRPLLMMLRCTSRVGVRIISAFPTENEP